MPESFAETPIWPNRVVFLVVRLSLTGNAGTSDLGAITNKSGVPSSY